MYNILHINTKTSFSKLKFPLQRVRGLIILFTCLFCVCNTHAQQLPKASPEEVGISSLHLKFADDIIEKAISDKEIPGAVLAVVKEGKMAYLRAYGNKEVYPNTVKMNENVVFDLASLTKPIATATSAMILIERGQLRLLDKVNLFIPDFQGWKTTDGKTIDIRVVDLLTHTSGLPSYAPVETLEKQIGAPNPDGLINYIATCKRDFEPLTNMQYSCLNYITLQRIIEIISKKSIRDFAKENIFDVLGMEHTDYQPKGETLALTAPTQRQKDGSVLRGIVHDPLARVMNDGISGNAGLFSDANDLAIFAAALLNGGEWNGKRILSPLGVKAMQSVPRHVAQFGRTPGWDVFSAYASNSGDLLGPNTYGHTGYTGTSMVIDPDNNLTVILLTNRAHPNDAGNIVRLRSLVANAVAASVYPPQRKYTDYYYQRLRQFQAEEPVTFQDIVMLGNSLTEGGGDWSKRLKTKNVRNRGIVGDEIMGIYDRLDQILPGKPQKIFLLTGANDVSHDMSTDSLVTLMDLLVNEIQTKSPETKLYLQSLLPINESFGRYKKLNGKTNQIPEINAKLKELAKKRNITFIDLFPLFTEKNTNILREKITTDGLHINAEGYEIWEKELKKHL